MLLSVLLVSASVLIVFGYSFTYNVTSDMKELTLFDADAAVIPGAAVWHGNALGDRPSPTLRQRINIGADISRRKVVPMIVVTGAGAPYEKTEADIAYDELIRLGVNADHIITESNSRSTIEQVVFLRENLSRKQGWNRFIIISDHYHLPRILEMCKFNALEAIGVPSPIRQSFPDLLYYRIRESFALIAYWLLGK